MKRRITLGSLVPRLATDNLLWMGQQNPEKWSDNFYDIYDENDIQLEATEHFKKTVKEVLSHYSNIVKIKF